MNNLKFPAVVLVSGTLAACGGSSSDVAEGLREATSNASLATVEANDQGTSTPVDDTRALVNGYVLSEGASNDADFSSATASIADGLATTIDINGTTYVIANGDTVSGDGGFVLLNDGTIDGNFSAVTGFGLGTDLAGAGQTTEVGVFVRGLATPTANLPTGTANYAGTATLATNGSSTSDVGTFGLAVEFGTPAVTGSVDIGTLNGTIAGNYSGNEVTGQITGTGISGMDLTANFFGPNGEEIAGGASGQFESGDAVIGFQGSR